MPRPPAPSPNLAARGDGVPIGLVTEVSRAGAGSGRAPKSSDSFSSLDTRTFYPNLAGVPGFEPGLSVLETDVLTVDTIPLHKLSSANFRLLIARSKREIGNRQLPIGNSLRLFMIGVLTATATELTKLQPIRRSLLILGRNVIAALTLTALKHNIIAWHKSPCPLSVVSCP